jgi:hypothetical protein
MSNELITDIEAFCHELGMNPSTFGRKAVNDGKLFTRLKGRGGRVWPETERRIRDFMAEQRAIRRLSEGRAA